MLKTIELNWPIPILPISLCPQGAAVNQNLEFKTSWFNYDSIKNLIEMNDFESVESSLKNHLPEGEYEQVRRILYGKDCKGIRSQNIFRAYNKSTKSEAPKQHHVNTKTFYRAPSLIKFGQFYEKVFHYLWFLNIKRLTYTLLPDPGSQDIPLSFKDGWQTKSYTVVKSTQVRTFDEVKAYCDQFGMKMPVPQSKDECKQLGKLADPKP